MSSLSLSIARNRFQQLVRLSSDGRLCVPVSFLKLTNQRASRSARVVGVVEVD